MTRERTPTPPATEEGRPTGRCPVCGRPRVRRYRPFCSAGCRDRDFLAWVEGRYALPALEEEPEEEQGER
jgi:endogenous inhibitor of DNA gyrase (YacG/DUF329 family)